MHDVVERKRAGVKAGRGAGAGRAARRDAMRPLGVAIALAEKPVGFTEVRSRRLQSLDVRARVDEKRGDKEEEKRRASAFRRPIRHQPASVVLQIGCRASQSEAVDS